MKKTPATEAQIERLYELMAKVRMIDTLAKANGHKVYANPIADVNYIDRKRKGMTIKDASDEISSWRRLVLYGNASLSLLDLPQV